MNTAERPDYKQIYMDILDKKFPERKADAYVLLKKENLSVMDILKLNQLVFNIKDKGNNANQKHRSYSKSDILQILDFQRKHNLNNSELAEYFKLSRNTVTKWKRIYLYL